MLISRDELIAIMPLAKRRAEAFHEPLDAAMFEFEIDTSDRIAAFIAQVAHESGELRYVRELASGAAYEGRCDIGNTQPGDGKRFKGRGLLQITGRANYRDASRYFFNDDTLLDAPEMLETPTLAARSAGWFWWTRALNPIADVRDFQRITRKINGGLNGIDSRTQYYFRALEVLR